MTTDDGFFFENEASWPQPPLPTWEDTVPHAFAQCPDCLKGSHTWSTPGTETFPGTNDFGTHTVLRHRCDCDICFGRCDGRQITIHIAQPSAAGHPARHTTPEPPAPPLELPHPRTGPHHKRTKESLDANTAPHHTHRTTLDLHRRPA